MEEKGKKQEQNKKQEQKKFIIGKVSTERKSVLLAFKDAKHLFERGSVWEAIRIFLPNKFPSGALILRRAGGLKDELNREVFVKKTIDGETLKMMLREYGFKKGGVRRYMLVRVSETGELEVEVVKDDVGGYQWDGRGWKYVRTWQEAQEDEIDFF